MKMLFVRNCDNMARTHDLLHTLIDRAQRSVPSAHLTRASSDACSRLTYRARSPVRTHITLAQQSASIGPRAALCSWDAHAMCGARGCSAAWAGASARRALERAALDVPRRCPSHTHLRERARASPGLVCARQAPSFVRRLYVPARYQSGTVADDPTTGSSDP